MRANGSHHLSKQPSGKNDVQDGQLKDWSNETSEWQYFEGTPLRYDTTTIRKLFNKIRDENDEGDFSDKREIKPGYNIPIGMIEKLVQVIVYQLVFLKK